MQAGLGPGGRALTEFEKIQQGRKKLPVFRYREEILSAIRDHQVGGSRGKEGMDHAVCVSLPLCLASFLS